MLIYNSIITFSLIDLMANCCRFEYDV